MKKSACFVIFILILLLAQTNLIAQACGGSYWEFDFVDEDQKPLKNEISYQLFYLAPKVKSPSELDYKMLAEFVSEFLYGDPMASEGSFWTHKLIEVEPLKAESYISSYRLEDFTAFYDNEFSDLHRNQLTGKAKKGQITFKTSETDIMPFILKVEAEGFETSYFVSAFLGGCRRGKNELIKMRKL